MAFLSLIPSVPAILLVTSGVSYSLFSSSRLGDTLNFDLVVFRPAVILGGLMVTVVLNLIPLMRAQGWGGSAIGMPGRGHVIQLGILALVGILSSIIFVYLLAENLQIFARPAP